MTPSELLVRAADLVRDTAAAATEGQWSVVAMRDHTYSLWSTGTSFTGEDEEVANAPMETDAAWIALASPAVAPAWEQLLRDAAKDWDVRARIFSPEAMRELATSRRFAGLLALARAVLGVKEDG